MGDFSHETVRMKQLGVKLRHLRQQQGLTTQELSDVLAVDRSLISKIETGKSIPSLPLALKIARFFGVTVDDLADDTREVM